jgi:uncharacterized SAM-binding protein YcdF (DUF218 family)
MRRATWRMTRARRPERGGIVSRLLSLLFLVVFFLVLFFVLYFARHPLMRLAGNWWVVSDRLDHAEAIVVLGDDNFSGDRAERAAELFKAGWAPQVVASGRMLRPYASAADFIARDLEGRGVPTTAVVPFAHHADSTLTEVRALRDLAVQHHWHSLLVVTSNYHTRRAIYIFRRVFPEDVAVLIEPARDSDYDPDLWWESRIGVKLFFTETVGYAFAMWELRMP